MENRLFEELMVEHKAVMNELENISETVFKASELIGEVLEKRRKILICGNGGSAADAQHFAAELVGRFEMEREALRAIALTSDTSAITALGNDYGFDTIFSRQVNALGDKGDVLIGISTSGNSSNVIRGIEAAKRAEMLTIGLLGNEGGKLLALVDIAVVVPDKVTARIQEAHIFILHYWSAFIERRLFS